MTAIAILQWIEQHVQTVIVQAIPDSRRRKNRVMLQYVGPDGQPRAVGSYTVAAAVERAAGRTVASGEGKAGL